MGLLSKFKFGSKSGVSTPPSGASSDASEVARDARVRARRRLIGASLLLGLGIVGFPLLFESRPRPIPVDIPIEIPAREGAAPLALPAPHAGKGRADVNPAQPVDELPASAALGERETIEPDASHGSRSAPAASKPEVSKPPVAKPEVVKPAVTKPEAAKAEAPKPAASKPAPPKPAAAKPEPPKQDPKPEAKPAATKPADHPADDGRFVVQIGAFAEVASAREARMKVEGMGLKTYTQVIESATGRRIRVRVGPYPTKAEADKAAARIKAGGLQAAVLVL
jgi:DedD protein